MTRLRNSARQRGVAVVTALLLTTLAITIVASLFWQQQVQVRSIENQRLQLQKQWILRGAIDWARTKYGDQSAEGVLDGGGTTYALLKRENGQWRVLEFVIGPTDVAYADWPERHDAPAGLMGLAAE